MNSFDVNSTNHHVIHSLEETPETILYKITLGVHQLAILSDQSIIVRCEQVSKTTQELHLDAMETYRLMQCLREIFQQTYTCS